jgi:hypothetical protein
MTTIEKLRDYCQRYIDSAGYNLALIPIGRSAHKKAREDIYRRSVVGPIVNALGGLEGRV